MRKKNVNSQNSYKTSIFTTKINFNKNQSVKGEKKKIAVLQPLLLALLLLLQLLLLLTTDISSGK